MDGRTPSTRMGLALALALLPAGCNSAQSSAEAEAIAFVERLGGKVKSDDTRSGRPIVEVALGGTRVTDAELARLAVFTELQTLSLFDTSVGDEGLEHVASLGKLQTLYLGRTRVTDAGLKRLATLNVGQAFQPDANRSDRQVEKPVLPAAAAGLGKLRTLGLSDTGVSDASVELLGQFAALRSVNLRHTRVTAAGVARLRESRPDLVVHF